VVSDSRTALDPPNPMHTREGYVQQQLARTDERRPTREQALALWASTGWTVCRIKLGPHLCADGVASDPAECARDFVDAWGPVALVGQLTGLRQRADYAEHFADLVQPLLDHYGPVALAALGQLGPSPALEVEQPEARPEMQQGALW
jgi:hypothetical protein